MFSPFSNIELKISEKRNEKIEKNIPYIVTNQDSTMYLETGNPCASGNYPYVGCVAVHKKSSTDRTPIFPFGTAIHYQGTAVNIGGKNYSDFIVEDTGVKKVSFTWD